MCTFYLALQHCIESLIMVCSDRSMEVFLHKAE